MVLRPGNSVSCALIHAAISASGVLAFIGLARGRNSIGRFSLSIGEGTASYLSGDPPANTLTSERGRVALIKTRLLHGRIRSRISFGGFTATTFKYVSGLSRKVVSVV